MTLNTLTNNREKTRLVALVVGIALVTLSGISSGGVASAQTTSNPVIFFNGNLLSNQAVHSEIGERPDNARIELNPLPLSRVMTTDRAGYSFGGWSSSPGEAPLTALTVPTESTSRILYAVWSTKINLDLNGATSGSVTGGATSIDYRFGQTATLPQVGTLKRKGYDFVGWTTSGTTSPLVTTYKAKPADNGNPSFVANWKKTITFSAGGGSGIVPSEITYFAGQPRISLPTVAQVSLTRAGFTFAGWATTPKGKPIKKADSYLPKKNSITLHAVWKKN